MKSNTRDFDVVTGGEQLALPPEFLTGWDPDAKRQTLLPALNVIPDILDERARQIQRWGDPHQTWGSEHTSAFWAVILTEEVGEVARAVLEGDENLRAELVQVAAVAVAWIESLDAKALDA